MNGIHIRIIQQCPSTTWGVLDIEKPRYVKEESKTISYQSQPATIEPRHLIHASFSFGRYTSLAAKDIERRDLDAAIDAHVSLPEKKCNINKPTGLELYPQDISRRSISGKGFVTARKPVGANAKVGY